MRQGGGEETLTDGGRGDARDYGEKLLGLWKTDRDSYIFKYLGNILTAVDDDWTVVVGKLKKVQKSWAQMTSILGWEGATRGSPEYF